MLQKLILEMKISDCIEEISEYTETIYEYVDGNRNNLDRWDIILDTEDIQYILKVLEATIAKLDRKSL